MGKLRREATCLQNHKVRLGGPWGEQLAVGPVGPGARRHIGGQSGCWAWAEHPRKAFLLGKSP